MKLWQKILALLLIFALALSFAGCDLDAETAQSITEGILSALLSDDQGENVAVSVVQQHENSDVSLPPSQGPPSDALSEDGWYDDVDSVTAYLVLYGRLPDNYLTKKEAQELGWQSGSDLWDYAPGMSIGGSHFGNYEGILPSGSYQEADIDYQGGSRNAKRIVYTVKGDLCIYYTDDHYTTFTKVYPEE